MVCPITGKKSYVGRTGKSTTASWQESRVASRESSASVLRIIGLRLMRALLKGAFVTSPISLTVLGVNSNPVALNLPLVITYLIVPDIWKGSRVYLCLRTLVPV